MRKPRAVVLLNAAAGSVAPRRVDETTGRIGAAFAEAGLPAEVRSLGYSHLEAEVRATAKARPDALVVGGGDGTLSTAAQSLAGSGVPLGILPLGTRNHFARDLGLPADLTAAVRVIAAGHVRRVDVGEVNGRVFINNCSLGVYADLVRDRETQEEREDRRRSTAQMRAIWGALRRFRVRTVTLTASGRVWRVTTPLVFVGNNRYELRSLARGGRPVLEAGQLWVSVARTAGRFGIVRLAGRALVGRLDRARDFETISATELEIRTRRRHLRVAVDGEVVAMRSPVRFRARPRALAVFAPPAEG
jgi:diacylglycerol kinase family enzyme